MFWILGKFKVDEWMMISKESEADKNWNKMMNFDLKF